MTDEKAAATQNNGNLDLLKNGGKTLVALALAIVAFGSCIAYLPNVINVVNLNSRTTELEKFRTTQEAVNQRIESSLTRLADRRDMDREFDRESQSRTTTQLNDIIGKMEGIKLAIADSSGRTSLIESKVAGLVSGVNNSLSKNDELEKRTAEVEARQAKSRNE